MVSSETQVVQSPPTHPEQHWRPSLRLRLLHLDPGQREPHLPAPSHISVTSTLAAHQFSSKPVLNIPAFRPAASRWCAHHARAAPPAVPGQLPFLCYLPGPILGSASPPVKLTFSLPSTLHVSSMILVSCPHIVLGAKKKCKSNEVYSHLFAWWSRERGRWAGEGRERFAGYRVKAMHQTRRFPTFQNSV